MEYNPHPVIYTSAPAPVSMADHWYEMAHPNHFWIRRRFEVLKRLAGPLIRNGAAIAEIGCGNGLVQRAIEEHYGVGVHGFDLNELALKKTISRTSNCYCYDIHQRSEEFRARFDMVLLLDVLEHIADEDAFLQSVKYHMTDSGVLIVNVPAYQSLYSRYDITLGHFRRYRGGTLRGVLERNGLRIRAWTYWGAGLMPLLIARKALTALRRKEEDIVSSGFDPGSRAANYALGLLARCEPIPQMLFGTSLMAVVEKFDS
jgi:SAM-dependent methyltransferase